MFKIGRGFLALLLVTYLVFAGCGEDERQFTTPEEIPGVMEAPALPA